MSESVIIKGRLESSEPHPDFNGKYRVTFVLDEPGSSVLMHATGSVMVVAVPPTAEIDIRVREIWPALEGDNDE